MKIGKTIASNREKAVSESERLAQRKKEERRKKMSVVIFFAALLLVIVVAAGLIMNMLNERKRNELPDSLSKTYTPTVEVIDEDGTGYVTDRIKSVVGMLEEDFSELKYKVKKAVVPTKTTREIDVYLEGVKPYFKIHLDRNTAESAEDAVRMIEYLKKENIEPSYVDVRIAGRAYYK